MKPITLWFNKNLSGTFNLIESVRAGQGQENFRIICSHTQKDFAALRLSDVAEIEPPGLGEAAYLDYCRDFIRRHQVDLFIPGKMLKSIVREKVTFADLGVRLLYAADAGTLATLENKASLYAAIPPGLVHLPSYRLVHDLAGFEEALAWLQGMQHRVCFKPAVSMFGLGFRILTENGKPLDRLLSGDNFHLSLTEARWYLAGQSRFRDLLVMQYLPGPERSVDCLAQDGRLLRCVVRRKPMGTEGGQLLEDNPAVEEMVRRLTDHFRLNGIFNIQFRDDADRPYLLEINPRPAGGLLYACFSGIDFMYWAVRLALGTAKLEDIPQPRTGLRIHPINQAIKL